MTYKIPLLPLTTDIESKAVLKKAAKAHQALAELKGIPHRSHALRGNALLDAPASRIKTTLERQGLSYHAERGNYNGLRVFENDL